MHAPDTKSVRDELTYLPKEGWWKRTSNSICSGKVIDMWLTRVFSLLLGLRGCWLIHWRNPHGNMICGRWCLGDKAWYHAVLHIHLSETNYTCLRLRIAYCSIAAH
ncbi:hypothetical protein A0H81_07181 [Grifola frondosa]|uniref:Uncharacterized protein n=1 Tax=Grifola frondosa TaxID=5627 RepID=A0A1C7M9C1_GRIFR|nr:hypothetical protein A0H81_07181 [Grifola frondosa]